MILSDRNMIEGWENGRSFELAYLQMPLFLPFPFNARPYYFEARDLYSTARELPAYINQVSGD